MIHKSSYLLVVACLFLTKNLGATIPMPENTSLGIKRTIAAVGGKDAKIEKPEVKTSKLRHRVQADNINALKNLAINMQNLEKIISKGGKQKGFGGSSVNIGNAAEVTGQFRELLETRYLTHESTDPVDGSIERALNIVNNITGLNGRKTLSDRLQQIKDLIEKIAPPLTRKHWKTVDSLKFEPIKQVSVGLFGSTTTNDVTKGVNDIITSFNNLMKILKERANTELKKETPLEEKAKKLAEKKPVEKKKKPVEKKKK